MLRRSKTLDNPRCHQLGQMNLLPTRFASVHRQSGSSISASNFCKYGMLSRYL